MSGDVVDAESRVSGTPAYLPARIRRGLGIEDGDHLRWHLDPDGTVRVDVVEQRAGSFADFDGYGGEDRTDVTAEHDAWGIDTT